MAVVDPSSSGCPNCNRDMAAAMVVAQCDINESALLLSGWVGLFRSMLQTSPQDLCRSIS